MINIMRKSIPNAIHSHNNQEGCIAPSSQSSCTKGASPGSNTKTLVAAIKTPSSVVKAFDSPPSTQEGSGQEPLHNPTSH